MRSATDGSTHGSTTHGPTNGTGRPDGVPLTDRQWRGLLRLGDVVVPGDDDLPSFSASGCAAAVGRMLPYMYDGDRSAFLMLCSAASSLPLVSLRALVAATGAAEKAGPLAPTLRMAGIGVKGVILSLYWSDAGSAQVCRAVGYEAHVTMHDPEPNAAADVARTLPRTGEDVESTRQTDSVGAARHTDEGVEATA